MASEPPWPYRTLFRGVLIATTVLALVMALLGYGLWRSVTISKPSVVFGQGASAPGAPSNARSLAAAADPGLVDIDVTEAYRPLEGAGTGMVLSRKGEILTNNHVIEDASTITVRDVGNNRTYHAAVVGYDRAADIAVLRLSGASGLHTLSFGKTASVAVGDGVVVVGNAGGVGGTPSYSGGSVTGTDRSITATDEANGMAEQLTGLLQTNAGVVPGDSGGGLLNARGQVIGMVTASTSGFEFQGQSTQGFAIPIDEALSVASQIESGHSSSSVHVGPTPFLGVEVEALPEISGAFLVEVIPGGPAARAGLAAADLITAIDERAVTSPGDLTSALLDQKPGTPVQVTYLDPSGAPHLAKVLLTSGPAQ